MNLQSYFSISLNDQQVKAVDMLEDFFNSDVKVFLLKGYAGTGKTTLIKGVVDALKKDGRKFVVCAPTGRAAKVLRNKTGYGSTIHSSIYDFEKLQTVNAENKDVAKHSFEYMFPIINLQEETVVIVDEASMISSKKSKNELFTFGTDVLLEDLLTFVQLQQVKIRNKLILIGDPAQLPPVGDDNSWALEKTFYELRDISVSEYTLTKVMRQEDNLILENAQRIRECIENPSHRLLEFKFDDSSCYDFSSGSISEKYCELFHTPEFNSGVIINYSNAQNLHYNNDIREIYFPGQKHVCAGDLVLIVNNNYHTYERLIFNGEFAKIVEVGEIEKQSAPVLVDEAGISVRKIFTFIFRKVKIILSGEDEKPFDAYINETLLESTVSDLTTNEMKALYINAVMRFQVLFPKSKINSEEFKNFLRNDPFFNAIRIKYGYAITGHKSQGGEWKTVFVDYYGQISLSKIPLRWCYTATTRASEQLYAVNYPNFGKFYKLKFNPVKDLSKIPVDFTDFTNVPLSPFHKKEDHRCKSFLYWNILEKCEDSPLKIENIISYDYLEKYEFSYQNKFVKAEAYHNGAGVFQELKLKEGDIEVWNKVQEILTRPNSVCSRADYHPSEKFLEDLYKIVQAGSNEAGFTISNVVERRKDYFVNYFLENGEAKSQLQFYFNSKNEITKVMVKTTEQAENGKINNLINKIQEYATIPTN